MNKLFNDTDIPANEEQPEVKFPRWKATVFYRANAGLVDVEHMLHELHEIHDYVERGPHWDTIDKIEIVRVNPVEVDLTVEKAKEL